MREVRIGELKAKLSEYLRAVQKGETLTVLDRDTPIAQISPVPGRPILKVRKPEPGAPSLGQIPLHDLGPLDIGVDVIALLDEEREDRV